LSSPYLQGPSALSPPSLADGGSVRGAIAQAAQSSGVDFNYLLGQARLESGMNPTARAATSSATGLYQFTNSTWSQTLSRHGAALGLSPQALADPAAHAQLMALRNDPQASSMMAAAMAGDNQVALSGALGRAPSSGELYLAHFLGADGAVKFLSAMASNPTQSAAALLPKAAAANRAVFFDASGAPRSLAQVMGLLNSRLASAMQDSGSQDGAGPDAGWGGVSALAGAGGSAPLGPLVWSNPAASAPADSPPAEASGGPLAQEFAQTAALAGGNGAGMTGSMADTLRATFGSDAGNATSTPIASGSTPDFVRSAYGRMQALGL
jgi:hypothetical protein